MTPRILVVEDEENVAYVVATALRLAGFETPKGVIFATALPETVGGKVLKYKLREQFAGHYQAAEHAATTMGEGEAGGVT